MALAHLYLGGGLVGVDPGHVCRFGVGIQVGHRAVVNRAGRVRAERAEVHIDRLMLDGAHIVVVVRRHGARPSIKLVLLGRSCIGLIDI